VSFTERSAVLLRGEEVLTSIDEMGTIVETTMLRHLYAYYCREIPTISHRRDITRNEEVDMFVKSPQYVVPIEVNMTADLESSSGLVELGARNR
jgi:predicted AAA+ superfamily ATPase